MSNDIMALNACADSDSFRTFCTGFSLSGLEIEIPLGRVTFASPALAEQLGYTPEECQKKSCWELTHPDEHSTLCNTFLKILQGQTQNFCITVRCLQKNGRFQKVELTGLVSAQGDGSFKLFANVRSKAALRFRPAQCAGQLKKEKKKKNAKRNESVLKELTEQTKQRAKEAEERQWILDTMMKQIPLAVVIAKGSEVNILAVSSWARELFNFPKDRPLDGPLAELPKTWSYIPGNGNQAVATDKLPIVRACRYGEAFQGEEWTIVRNDGLSIPVLCSGGPIYDHDGNLWGGVVAFQDCWSQKKAHAAIQSLNTRLQEKVNELETLLDTLPVSVWIADKDCQKVIGNRFGYELAGVPAGTNMSLTCPEEQAQIKYECFYRDRKLGLDQLPLRKVALTGKPICNVEFDAVFTDGRKVSIYGNVRPILDNNNQVQGVIAAFIDIGERRRMEAALEEQARALKEADQKKDEFLAMLAHELRNPLAALKSAYDLSNKPGIDSRKLQFATQVFGRQLKQLSRIVDDLLDVSRITHGKIQLQKKLLSLSKILHNVIPSHQALMKEKSRHFSYVIAEEELWIDGDEVRLEQVFVNLLSNAIKYTPEGGRIELRAQKVKQQAVIQIKDTGIGLTADLLPKIFDLFTQGDMSLDRSRGGLGIGLTLAKKLIELHGGSMSAESAGEGLGSQFTIKLPLAASPYRPVWQSPAMSAKNSTEKATRILVVDDNPDLATLVGEILKMAGHKVHLAYDGPSCLQLIDVFEPHVIILDIGLPQMTGHDVAKKIKEVKRYQNIYLIALSGYGQPEDKRKSKEIGFNCHLVKPIDDATLLAKVAKGIKNYHNLSI